MDIGEIEMDTCERKFLEDRGIIKWGVNKEVGLTIDTQCFAPEVSEMSN